MNSSELESLGWHGIAGYSDDLDRIAYSSLTREGHIVFDGGGNQAYGYRFGNRTIYPESPNSARSAFNKLNQTMNSYLANSTNLPVAHRWTGIIGMSLNRKPLIGISADVYFAVNILESGACDPP